MGGIRGRGVRPDSLLWVDLKKLPRWITALMIFYILAVPLLNRDMLGSRTSFLLDSYHILTWALAALLAATVGSLRICDRQSVPEESR